MPVTTVIPPFPELTRGRRRLGLHVSSYPSDVQLAGLAWSFARNSSRLLVICRFELVTESLMDFTPLPALARWLQIGHHIHIRLSDEPAPRHRILQSVFADRIVDTRLPDISKLYTENRLTESSNRFMGDGAMGHTTCRGGPQ